MSAGRLRMETEIMYSIYKRESIIIQASMGKMGRDISHSKITPHEEERKSKNFRKIINGYESMEP